MTEIKPVSVQPKHNYANYLSFKFQLIGVVLAMVWVIMEGRV